MIKSLFRNKGYNDLSTSYEHIVNNNYDYNYEGEHLRVRVYDLDMLDKIIEKEKKHESDRISELHSHK